MKSNETEPYEDRNNTHRYLSTADQKLLEIKGEPYRLYREAFDLARLEKRTTQAPLEVALGVTSGCNLLCKMCYRNYFPSHNGKYMDLNLLERVARELEECHVASIWLGSFTEATIHPQINEIIERLGRIGAQDFWLTTNGTHLDERLSHTIVKSGVTKLHVSIDAASPDAYRRIRGGDLGKIEDNVRRLLAIRSELGSPTPLLRVTFCEQPDNAHEVIDFVEKWRGVADIVDTQKMTDYEPLRGYIGDDGRIAHNEYLAQATNSPESSFFDCYYPFYQLGITYDGQLWPCPCPIYDVGERVYIQDCSLMSYWKGDELQRLRDSILTGELLACCRTCLSLKVDR